METGIQGITWRAQDAQKDSDKYNQEVRDLNTVSEIQKKLETLQSGIEFLDANLLHLLSHFNVEDEKERTARSKWFICFKKGRTKYNCTIPESFQKDRLMEALTMHYPNATIQSLTQIYETIYSDGNKQTEQ
ncbi:MAG: hypothetical protein R3E39_30070 [Anaerolineae bacterium]